MEYPPSQNLQQESQLIPNKVDNDGHHYLKVLLLSNKMSRNKWQAPYDKIGNIPKQVLDSYIGLPYIEGHNYEFFNKLDDILYNSGLSDEQVNKALKDECSKEGVSKGYIDHLFMDDLNASALYGQLKITDPEENKYIEQNKRPSFKFTSPAINGLYTEDQNGYKTYNLDTIRAFHVASVPVPAFLESEAKVKGVCSGTSDSCKRDLAYAGLNPDMSTPTSSTPTENVNNSCGCNKNIQEMSTNNQQQTQSTIPTVATVTSEPNSAVITSTGNLLSGAQNTTQEAILAARTEAQKVIKESQQQAQIQAPKKDENNEDNKDEVTSNLKSELRKYKQDYEAAQAKLAEQNNFFLDEILTAHIPQAHFKKEEEYVAEKESMKSFITKYSMSLQDAKWLITKTAKGIPNQNEENNKEDNKKDSKRSPAYAGFLSGATTYNSDIVTKTTNTSVPKPVDNSSIEDDYPLGIE